MSERGAVVGAPRRDGRADVLRQHAARARREHVEAGVGDDPVHPRAEARARLVGRERSPTPSAARPAAHRRRREIRRACGRRTRAARGRAVRSAHETRARRRRGRPPPGARHCAAKRSTSRIFRSWTDDWHARPSFHEQTTPRKARSDEQRVLQRQRLPRWISRTSRHGHGARRRSDLRGLGGSMGQAPELALPDATLQGEVEARRRRRDRHRQPYRRAYLPAHRRQHHGQAHVRARRADVARGSAVPHAGVRADLAGPRAVGRPGGTTFYFVNDGIESARSGKRAPRPAIATSASPAAPTRSSVTSAPV